MAKRIVTKIGYVFCVYIDGKYKQYFQYIANDLAYLNSSVIRVFKKSYGITDELSIDDIINEEVDFYAHTILRSGIENNLWEKVGRSEFLGDLDIFFRAPRGDLKEWYVWKLGEDLQSVIPGKQHQHFHIGVVFNPHSIVDRIKTGKYIGYK